MKKILIAEDNKPMAEVLSIKLVSAGFITQVVYDGEAVIVALRQSRFDLLILDLIIPKKDGFSVLEELKNLKIAMPVIVSFNSDKEEYIKRAKKLGAKDYFVKPDTTLVKIVEKVEQLTQLTIDKE